MSISTRWQLAALVSLGLLVALAPACDDDDDGAGGDSDTDTDTDTDTDADQCEDIEWGSGLKVGEAVSNWVQSGYIDSDLDGVVEQEEVEFDLDLIRCTGKESMVIVYGDTS